MEEKIFYNSTDNIKLCGLLSKVNNNKEIVILCHGLISNKESKGFNTLVKELQLNNINSFRFDFRSRGESTGNFIEMTPTKEVSDLEATVNYLRELGYEKIILLGSSFGGSIVSLFDYEKYDCIKGIILWYSALDYMVFTDNNSFFSKENKDIVDKCGYFEMTNRNNDSFKLGKELYKEVYNLVPYKNIIDLEIPILFVHGLNDEIVPYELSIKVSKMCKMAKLELIENGNHSFKSDISTLNKAVDVTLDFIQKIFK